jgi:hypothetical protein
MFCPTNCNNTCRLPCNVHLHTHTLILEIANRANQNFTYNPITENNASKNAQNPSKIPKEMLNLHKHPIKTIFDKKTYERKDKYGSTKKFTSYKCQWKLLDNQKYTTWIPTNNLFPYNNNNISEHNLIILTQYFQSKQQKRHQNIINK